MSPLSMTTTRSAISATTPISWGDEHHRHADFLLELADELEDLGLNGDVERRGRLVGDQQLRLAGERHGDHHALAHAARECMGKLAQTPARIGNAHQVEQGRSVSARASA